MKTKIITRVILLALGLGISTCLLTAQDNNQRPSGPRPPSREGGPGGPGAPGGFHLMPPRAIEQLNLTEDQQKQLAALEAEVKAKVEKILTSEQLEQLKRMRPPLAGPRMRGPGQGPGGPRGPRDQGEFPEPRPPRPPAPEE